MTFQQLQYLLEVHKAGSFSQAAKNLYITQSAISNAIIGSRSAGFVDPRIDHTGNIRVIGNVVTPELTVDSNGISLRTRKGLDPLGILREISVGRRRASNRLIHVIGFIFFQRSADGDQRKGIIIIFLVSIAGVAASVDGYVTCRKIKIYVIYFVIRCRVNDQNGA